MEHTQYYLGANSVHGFYSLYDNLCPPDGDDFLWVIKGGPGCGKSSFMRRIAEAMANSGHDVQYILCSGDPDSLDGVYFPALHVGYVDGTSPHVQEVAYPAASGLYLDLGQFYDRAALIESRKRIRALNLSYKGLYASAYRLLAACPAPQDDLAHEAPPALRALEEQQTGKLQKRFLRAVTCKGLVSAEHPPCSRVREISSQSALSQLAQNACELGYEVITAQHPLFPTLCESVHIPALDTLYFYSFAEYDASVQPVLREACAVLAEAKTLHDELEAVYNPHVDFDGVYALAEKHIQALFK